MNVNQAYSELMDVVTDNSVSLTKEEYNGNPLWCIRWIQNDGWSKNRICLAGSVNNPPHATPGSAFNEWYTMKCHNKITCTNGLPSILEDWIKRIQE